MLNMGADKIRAIFFSEFHPIAGPKITYQFPEDYISKEFFDAIHISYIITKPELQSRLITVHAKGKKIIGCPVCIENKKYDRNALLFNMCFVFDAETRTTKYETSVRKLAGYMTQLELESDFLSNENSKAEIPNLLKDILTNLNQSGSCSLRIIILRRYLHETSYSAAILERSCHRHLTGAPHQSHYKLTPLSHLDASCTIHLKVSSSIDEPRPVQDQDVPIFLRDKPPCIPSQWDLTTQQVLQYIDGYNHVAKIASEADIEINLVKACLQNLLHYDVITVISIFQYSNMYTTTDQIRLLADDSTLQEECLKYIACKGRALPLFRDVLMLYSSLTPGFTVKDMCMRFNPHSMKVDEKKLIQFGLRKKIIRRLHCYPVKLQTPGEPELPSKKQNIIKYMNGTHSMDEISCKTGYNYKELEEFIENDPSILTCWK